MQGGLGNQLFQWAFARALQDDGFRVILDYARCRGDRPLMLGELTRSVGRLPRVAGWGVAAADRLAGAWSVAQPLGVTRLSERSFGIDTGLLDGLGRLTVLTGYFQSPSYFRGVEHQVRGEIIAHLRSMLTDAGRRFADLLVQDERAVAVHVRRGDYISNASAAAHHGVLDGTYYAQALDRLREHGERRVVWFSDDLEWVGRELAGPEDELCPPGLTTAAGGEVALMASCRSRVIANSSFSWWAGFLGAQDSDAATVIAPRQWFADGHDAADHLIPGAWIRL